jgi:4-amino-4-deoxy-L-arabinose transferase-like glycosyltransferase
VPLEPEVKDEPGLPPAETAAVNLEAAASARTRSVAGGRDRARPNDAPAGLLLFGLAGAVVVILIGLAGAYGYHRDELYFLEAGRHLAWAYADQGPLTPLIAHLMDLLSPGSLTILRVPSALMTGGTVATTGLIAYELDGSPRAQLIAAACAAVASVVLVVGHLLSTSTFDLLAWATVTWLVARIIRTRDDRLWIAAGAVTGVALLNKPLIAFLLVGLGLGLLTVGPRGLLCSGLLWAGTVTALLLWAPWLIWQARHGWPQLSVSSSIASGGSASSQPRWALLPFQFLLVSPVLAPVWIGGLVALLRRSRLRRFRLFALAWIFLVVAFTITGGKPYYLAGMFPVLLGAGALEADAWLARGSSKRRGAWLWGLVVLSGIVSAFIALPLLPADSAGPAVALNSDAGETIGWPELTRTVARVERHAGPDAVIYTSNYGEAGAIDRYGPALGLPAAYSGHNAFGYWGPPPDRPGPVVTVGLRTRQLTHFRDCRLVARIENAAGIDNEERGRAVEQCAGLRGAWSTLWPKLRHLG